MQLEWCKDGEYLAILQENEGAVTLWHAATRNTEILDTNSKEASHLCWSKTGPFLAIGTSKGNLLIYNKKTMKKQIIMGKHSKKITCGCWSADDQISIGF